MKTLRRILGTAVTLIVLAGTGCDTGNDSDKTAGTDAETGTDGAFGCGSVMSCGKGCYDEVCWNVCVDKLTTANGKTLLDAVVGCGSAECPSENGGTCEDAASKKCSDCWSTALSGACKTKNDACKFDG